MSVFAVNGEIAVTSNLAARKLAVLQAITDIQSKGPAEMLVPHGGTPTDVPLNLPTGVTEVVLVALYCAMPLTLVLTSSDSVAPGPMRAGLKGWYIHTLVPGEGLVSISAINSDVSVDAELVYYAGLIPAGAATPDFWST